MFYFYYLPLYDLWFIAYAIVAVQFLLGGWKYELTLGQHWYATWVEPLSASGYFFILLHITCFLTLFISYFCLQDLLNYDC